MSAPDTPPCPLRAPRSLSHLTRVALVRQVHLVACNLEQDYIDRWLERELSLENKELERRLDLRGGDYDTAHVVKRFRETQEEVMRLRLRTAARVQQQNSGRGDAAGGKKSGRKGRRGSSKAVPLHIAERTEADLRLSLQPRVVSGIPEGVADAEFIEYRKCKYVEDVAAVRQWLEGSLGPGALGDLMETMCDIAAYNDKADQGLLTLQTMLTTDRNTNFT